MSASFPRVQQAWQDWNAFWLAPAAVAPLAVARIGLGLCMFWAYVLYAPFIEQLFGPESLGAYFFGPDFLIRQYTWLIFSLTLVFAFFFAVGFITPISGVGLIVTHLAFIEPSHFFSWGWTPTVPAFLWYLSLGPSAKAYSVDAWIARRWLKRPYSEYASAWSLRLIQIHIVAIYIGASWHRVDDSAWQRGEMVFDAVAYAYFSRFPNVDWHLFRPVLEVLNYVVWGLELLAPLGLVLKHTRLWFAVGLWLMHLGLELTSTIGWWQLMMMSVLFTYFPESWSKRLLSLCKLMK